MEFCDRCNGENYALLRRDMEPGRAVSLKSSSSTLDLTQMSYQNTNHLLNFEASRQHYYSIVRLEDRKKICQLDCTYIRRVEKVRLHFINANSHALPENISCKNHTISKVCFINRKAERITDIKLIFNLFIYRTLHCDLSRSNEVNRMMDSHRLLNSGSNALFFRCNCCEDSMQALTTGNELTVYVATCNWPRNYVCMQMWFSIGFKAYTNLIHKIKYLVNTFLCSYTAASLLDNICRTISTRDLSSFENTEHLAVQLEQQRNSYRNTKDVSELTVTDAGSYSLYKWQAFDDGIQAPQTAPHLTSTPAPEVPTTAVTTTVTSSLTGAVTSSITFAVTSAVTSTVKSALTPTVTSAVTSDKTSVCCRGVLKVRSKTCQHTFSCWAGHGARCLLMVLLLVMRSAPTIQGLRVSSIAVPRYLVVGQRAILSCQLDLQADQLYSLTWWKDGKQFYQYIPSKTEPAVVFTVPGIAVNPARSAQSEVELMDVRMESSGLYRCEAVADAPSFATDYRQSNMTVLDTAALQPLVMGVSPLYRVGDPIRLNCSAPEAPSSHTLVWTSGGQEIHKEHVTLLRPAPEDPAIHQRDEQYSALESRQKTTSNTSTSSDNVWSTLAVGNSSRSNNSVADTQHSSKEASESVPVLMLKLTARKSLFPNGTLKITCINKVHEYQQKRDIILLMDTLNYTQPHHLPTQQQTGGGDHTAAWTALQCVLGAVGLSVLTPRNG